MYELAHGSIRIKKKNASLSDSKLPWGQVRLGQDAYAPLTCQERPAARPQLLAYSPHKRLYSCARVIRAANPRPSASMNRRQLPGRLAFHPFGLGGVLAAARRQFGFEFCPLLGRHLFGVARRGRIMDRHI